MWFCFLILFSLCVYSTQIDTYATKFPTVDSWLKTLPSNRYMQNGGYQHTDSFGFKNLSEAERWQEFDYFLTQWLDMMSKLLRGRYWITSNTGAIKLDNSFFDIENNNLEFQPFAQKLVLPLDNGIYVRGDLHGDIFSLLQQVQDLYCRKIIDSNFKLLQPDVWIVFLGDYVDRGFYGCEVLYTMMRLAVANPNRIVYVRGNHEDSATCSRYGFREEVKAKFNDRDSKKFKKICHMYDYMPVVCYIGCSDNLITNYLQCCHGGIEMGYDPKDLLDDNQPMAYQLIGELHQEKFMNKLKQYLAAQPYTSTLYLFSLLENKKPNPDQLGFMWTDFDVEDRNQLFHDPSRGFKFGQLSTRHILELMSSDKSKIRGILRAHQHVPHDQDPMMRGLIESKGIYKLWRPYESQSQRFLHDGLVWTFNVGPDSVYGDGAGFDFDAYAKLTVQSDYKDWTMTVYNTKLNFLRPTAGIQ